MPQKPCPGVPAERTCKFSSFPVPQRPSAACWGCGCHTLPPAWCSWGNLTGLPGAAWDCLELPKAAHGCPLPAWLNTARPIPPALGGGAGAADLARQTPSLWENTWRLGQSRTHLGSTSCHMAAAHPPVPPWALLLPHDPLPRLLQAVSPLQVLGPRGMQHPPQHPPGRCLTLGPWVPLGAPLAPATAGGEPLQPPSCMGRAPGSPAYTRDWEGTQGKAG